MVCKEVFWFLLLQLSLDRGMRIIEIHNALKGYGEHSYAEWVDAWCSSSHMEPIMSRWVGFFCIEGFNI